MTGYFIDTHCHFDFPPFSGAEAESLARAADAGVRQILVPTVTADRFAGVLALAKRYRALYAALGLHPLYIEQHQQDDVLLLESYLAAAPQKLIAVGEVGLDLYQEHSSLAQQQSLLRQQLALAQRYDLPVMLHSRRAHDPLAAELRRANLARTGVVHGFAGSLVQAQRFIQLGYLIGVGGTITYARAQKTRQVMAQLPLTALLLETDAPDMPLAGYQGQPNRPERAAQVFAALCSLRPEPAEVIANALFENSIGLFSLPWELQEKS